MDINHFALFAMMTNIAIGLTALIVMSIIVVRHGLPRWTLGEACGFGVLLTVPMILVGMLMFATGNVDGSVANFQIMARVHLVHAVTFGAFFWGMLIIARSAAGSKRRLARNFASSADAEQI